MNLEDRMRWMKDNSNWFIEFWRAQIGFYKPQCATSGMYLQDCHWWHHPMICWHFTRSPVLVLPTWIMRCLQVCFCLVPKFLDATLRHFDFMLRGLVGRLEKTTCFPDIDSSFFDESRTKDVLGYLIACHAMYIMKWYEMLINVVVFFLLLLL